MPTPQREALRRLTRGERTGLQRIADSTSQRVDQVRRAAALLAVARTGVFIRAAREAGLHSGTTVADLVARFDMVAEQLATESAPRRVSTGGNEHDSACARRRRHPACSPRGCGR